MKARRSIACFLLMIFFALSVVLSFDFLAANATHDCTGDRCQICAVMQTAEEITGGTKEPATPPHAAAFEPVLVEVLPEKAEQPATATPVSLCDVLTN